MAETAAVARALREAIEAQDRTIAEVARSADVDRTTIHDLLAGRAYIDIVTLARLEHATHRRLWPRTI